MRCNKLNARFRLEPTLSMANGALQGDYHKIPSPDFLEPCMSAREQYGKLHQAQNG